MTLPPPSSPVLTPVGSGPLSAEQLAQVTQATQRSTKIRRARKVAACDAGLTAVFAAITLLSGLFSPVGLLLGLALAAVAYNGFRGLRLLRRWDLRGPRLLALNQLLLAAFVITYALYCIYDATVHPPVLTAAGADPQLVAMLGPYEQLAGVLTRIVYLAVIGGTILAQGLAAAYYWSREKYLRAYLAETPAWVRQLQATLTA